MRRRKVLLIAAVAALVCGALVGMLYYQGILWFNSPSREEYPVWGVDVSSYQGEIDWPTLAGEGMQFAFIKATEGSGHQDGQFLRNWEEARTAGLKVGAYHFFSYDSPGETQAENFISLVPVLPDALPPVVDIEFYGGNDQNPPAREDARRILDPLLSALEAYYGCKPILYATGKVLWALPAGRLWGLPDLDSGRALKAEAP